jgi:hypothetical protein
MQGALWFTEEGANKIGRITIAGAVSEYAIPTASSQPEDITMGPDGALWFTELKGNKIGRITTVGAVTEYVIPTASSQPEDITTGPDSAMSGFTAWSRTGHLVRIGEEVSIQTTKSRARQQEFQKFRSHYGNDVSAPSSQVQAAPIATAPWGVQAVAPGGGTNATAEATLVALAAGRAVGAAQAPDAPDNALARVKPPHLPWASCARRIEIGNRYSRSQNGGNSPARTAGLRWRAGGRGSGHSGRNARPARPLPSPRDRGREGVTLA